MSGLAIILGIILVLVYVLVSKSINDKKIKEAEEELEEEIIEMVGGNPVKLEVLPYGTKRNPVLCKKGEEIFFTVIGWADHKMTQKVDIKFTDITWHKSCPIGRFINAYGVTNTYIAPNVVGIRDLWVKHEPTKISAKTKIKVEE